MKNSFGHRIGFALLLLISSGLMVGAEEPARPRSAPIVFSGPKSDSVSTNLNDLRAPGTPLQDMEMQLKRSFEGLDKSRPGPDFRESRRINLQGQAVKRKSLKDSLNQRAEDMFLNPDLYDADKESEAFFQLDKSMDPNKQKPKTSLERYNDQQDRSRMAVTNRAAGRTLFGEKNPGRSGELEYDSKAVKPFKTGRYTEAEANDSLSLFSRATTNGSLSGVERSASTRNADRFGRALKDPVTRPQTGAETRMEEFKRLLEGPRNPSPAADRSGFAATPTANYGATSSGYPGAASSTVSRPVTASSPAPEWSGFRSPTKDEPKADFARSAGLVGKLEKPLGLPEFPTPTASMAPAIAPAAPAPSPIKKFPNATFKLPQRRF